QAGPADLGLRPRAGAGPDAHREYGGEHPGRSAHRPAVSWRRPAARNGESPMSGRRSLVGLIGANIMSSLSPALQEDAFAAAGIRGTYHLMDLDRLPGRRLEHLMAAVKAAGFDGINVTFPCKTAVLPLLEEVSADARQIGAVNCVTIANDGRTVGYNTDRIGFRRNFEDGLGRACIEGKTAVLVGAGGAGRAVAFALMDLGAARV